MASSKRYRSIAAAERAKARVERDVPQARVEVNEDRTLTVWVYTAALTPRQREIVEEHDHRTPAAPSPRTPLLASRAYRPSTNPSRVRNPGEVCGEIFGRRHAEGVFDNRKAAIDEAIEAGVNSNTAKVYYQQFRQKLGLPGIRKTRKARASHKSPVSLSAHGRPAALRVCNGVTEPAVGTLRREVWDMADVLHRSLGRVPMRGEVEERLTSASKDTVKKAYIAWRHFHNLPFAGQYHKRT